MKAQLSQINAKTDIHLSAGFAKMRFDPVIAAHELRK